MSKSELAKIYHLAAEFAFKEKIDAGNESELTLWIQQNCSYRPDTEFFLVLGIGAELADMQAQAKGFKSMAHEAFKKALEKYPHGLDEFHNRLPCPLCG